MQISPISLINNFKNVNTISRKVQPNVFQNSNQGDTVSFSGVKKNKFSFGPLSYEKEMRRISPECRKNMSREEYEASSDMDKLTNEFIEMANKMNKDGEKLRKEILEASHCKDKSKRTIVTDDGKETNVVIKNKGSMKAGKIQNFPKRVLETSETKNEVHTIYKYDAVGKLDSVSKESSKSKMEATFTADEIKMKKHKGSKSSNISIIFASDNSIIESTAELVDSEGVIKMEKERAERKNNHNYTIKVEENGEKRLFGWVEYK